MELVSAEVKLWTYAGEVLGTNLGRDTLQANVGIVSTSIRVPFPSTSFLIHQSFYHPTFLSRCDSVVK
jgi:hypothetical protein